MGFNEVELIKSLSYFHGYDLNEEQLTELLVSDDDNFVQRFHIGFMFMVENINEIPSFTYMRVLNDIISENKLFYCDIKFEEEINQILKVEDPYHRIGRLLIYLFKNRVFNDSNEATALLFASLILIQYRIGAVIVPTEFKNRFKELMVEDEELFVEFISRFCIDRSLFSS